MDQRDREQLNTMVQLLKLGKGHRLRSDPFHICNGMGCNPQNELSLVPLDYQMGNSDVYLCDLGAVHICTQRDCALYINHGMVCPISGCKYGDEFSYWTIDRAYDIDKKVADAAPVVVNERNNFMVSSSRTSKMINSSGVSVIRQTKRRRVITKSSKNMFDLDQSCLSRVNGALSSPVQSVVYNRINGRPLEIEKEPQNAKLITENTPEVSSDAEEGMVNLKLQREKTLRKGYCQMRDKVETLIIRLLYSGIRKQINEEQRRHAEVVWNREKDRYLREVESQCKPVNEAEMFIIRMNTREHYHEMPIIAKDAKRLKHYVDEVMRIWRVVVQYGNPGNVNAGKRLCVKITLGTLYSMTSGGICIQEVYYLKDDPWLLEVLPPIKHLQHFELDDISNRRGIGFRKAYTEGRKLIAAVFISALTRGAKLSELLGDVNRTTSVYKEVEGKKQATSMGYIALGGEKPILYKVP